MRKRILVGSAATCGHNWGRYRNVSIAVLRACTPVGQNDAEDGVPLRRALQRNRAAMILHDFLHYRQSHPGTVFFAVADEGMKQAIANRFGNPGAIVAY